MSSQISPESFFLCRIIGNDLVPRHAPGQSLDNVRFILDHEPEFEGCEKFWIINRIFDEAERRKIADLLDERGQNYETIPFDLAEYGKLKDDLSRLPSPDFMRSPGFERLEYSAKLKIKTSTLTAKNIYAINNNGARNLALTIGRARARWVMPWDGNCFLTQKAWDEIRATVLKNQSIRYFIVPMARLSKNVDLQRDDFIPPAKDEPQIVFRRDAAEMFDERYPYGQRPKVELLWRLKVPGVWDRFPQTPADMPRPKPGRDAGQFVTAGWVARLSSGKPELETGDQNLMLRAIARDRAIVEFLEHLDKLAAESA